MEFTGERFIPGKPELVHLYQEHMTRYMFARHLVAGKNVIDLGCGAGYGSFYMAKSGAASVLGIDNSSEAINYCDNHYTSTNLTFQVGDVTGLRNDRLFDVAVAFELIEHIEKYAEFLITVKNHLVKDGLLILSTPNKNTYTTGNEFHFREFYPEEFSDLLKEHYRNVAIYHQGYPSTIAIVEETASNAGSDEIIEIPVGYSYPNPKLNETSLYLIALCSDSSIPTVKSELFLFGEDTILLEQYSRWRAWSKLTLEQRVKLKLKVKLKETLRELHLARLLPTKSVCRT